MKSASRRSQLHRRYGNRKGNTMFCPKCRAENPTGATFCRNCGANLGDRGNARANASVERSATNQTNASSSNVCPKCGAPLRPGATFCAKCGAKINPKTRIRIPESRAKSVPVSGKRKLIIGAAVAAIALVLIGVGVSHANSNGASDADTTSATSSDSSTGITQSEMESLLNNDTSRFSGDWKSDDGHYELSITKGGGFVKDLKDPNATAAAMTFLVNADGTLDSKQHPGYKLTLTDDTHLTLVNTNDNTQISFTFQHEREAPRQNKDFTGNWVYKAGDTTVAEVEITEDSYTITANGETETHTVTITDESGTGLEWCDDQGNLGDIQYADNGTDIKVTAFNIIDPTSTLNSFLIGEAQNLSSSQGSQSQWPAITLSPAE